MRRADRALGRRTLQVALALVLALAPSLAHAGDDAHARAVHLFEESAKAYKSGDFAGAIVLLEEARSLKADPILDYNLARAYEGQGDLANAVVAYEQYLRASPNADDAGAVRARVVTLRRQMAAAVREPTPAPPPAPAPAPAPRTRTAGPWVLGGTGVAIGAAGVVFGALAVSRHDAALSSSSQADAESNQSDARSFATIANVGWVAGGTLLAVALVWGLLEARGGRGRAAMAEPFAIVW